MQTEPFKVGDVVTLVSGGPKMTVEPRDCQNDYVNVVWMHDGHVYRDAFHKDQLGSERHYRVPRDYIVASASDMREWIR